MSAVSSDVTQDPLHILKQEVSGLALTAAQPLAFLNSQSGDFASALDSFYGEPRIERRLLDGQVQWTVSINPSTASFTGEAGSFIRRWLFQPGAEDQSLVPTRLPLVVKQDIVSLSQLFAIVAVEGSTIANALNSARKAPSGFPDGALVSLTSWQGPGWEEGSYKPFLLAGPGSATPYQTTVLTAPDDMALRNYVAGGSENVVQPGFRIDTKGNIGVVVTQHPAKARAKTSGVKTSDDISLPDGRVLTQTINASLQSGECCSALTILRREFATMMEEAAGELTDSHA